MPTRAGVAHVCFITDVFTPDDRGLRVAGHVWTTMVLDAIDGIRTKGGRQGLDELLRLKSVNIA